MDYNLLDGKRLIGDKNADAFTRGIFKAPDQKADLRNWLTSLTKNNQLDDLPALYKSQKLFKNINQLPAWANRSMMQNGAEFFAQHAEGIMNLLGLLSLPYCYTAANGAMVLYLSERMRTDAGKRLSETAEFVWEVMSPDAFSTGGSGFTAILKVRMMHSAIRYYTVKSGKWDKAWGLPVNQEDMAGTNLSFSLMVIRGLRKFGFSISYRDQQAYLHLWNVIGYLLGLEEELLSQTGKSAFDLEFAISKRQFRGSKQGIELTASLTNFFFEANTGKIYSNAEISQLMRYLLGNDVADMLGIAADKLPDSKIKLLTLKTYLQQFALTTDSRQAYQEGFSRFKQFKNNF